MFSGSRTSETEPSALRGPHRGALSLVEGGSSIPSRKSTCPAALEKALETPEVGVTRANVFTLIPGAWQPPKAVSQNMREAARDELRQINDELIPAHSKKIYQWLSCISGLTTARTESEQLDSRFALYIPLLKQFPLGCFTRETMEHVVRANRFFPAYAEVVEILEAEAAQLRMRAERLHAIMTSQPIQKPASRALVSRGPRPLFDGPADANMARAILDRLQKSAVGKVPMPVES